MSNVIFSYKLDGIYPVALVLLPNASSPVEETDGGYEDLQDLQERITSKYDGAEFVSPKKFKQAIAERQVHPPEMLSLLKQYNELLGTDITSHFVYGSAYRPTNTMFYGLENAVHMQVDKSTTGYFTYIATPEMLEAETIKHYDLQFVSRAA